MLILNQDKFNLIKQHLLIVEALADSILVEAQLEFKGELSYVIEKSIKDISEDAKILRGQVESLRIAHIPNPDPN